MPTRFPPSLSPSRWSHHDYGNAGRILHSPSTRSTPQIVKSEFDFILSWYGARCRICEVSDGQLCASILVLSFLVSLACAVIGRIQHHAFFNLPLVLMLLNRNGYATPCERHFDLVYYCRFVWLANLFLGTSFKYTDGFIFQLLLPDS
jgi:hypothetical protein